MLLIKRCVFDAHGAHRRNRRNHSRDDGVESIPADKGMWYKASSGQLSEISGRKASPWHQIREASRMVGRGISAGEATAGFGGSGESAALRDSTGLSAASKTICAPQCRQNQIAQQMTGKNQSQWSFNQDTERPENTPHTYRAMGTVAEIKRPVISDGATPTNAMKTTEIGMIIGYRIHRT